MERPVKEELENYYISEKKSTYQIAKIYSVSTTPVKRWLKEYEIPLRTFAEASKITLNGFKAEEKHLNWVGDKVSYSALHSWVRKHKGTPLFCEFCGDESKKKYEWCNTNGKYLRNLDDWLRLCTSCHRKFDNNG